MRGGEVAAAVVCRAMRCGATLGGGGGGRGWVARVREGADGCMETGAHGRWGAAGPAVARHICLYVQTGGVVVCTRWESPLSRRWVAGFACFAGGEAAYSPSVVGCVRPGVFFSSRSLLRARMACGASGRRGPSGVPQALSSACQRSGDGRAVVLRGESCRWLGGGRGGEVVLAAAGQGRPRWRLLFLPCHCVLFFWWWSLAAGMSRWLLWERNHAARTDAVYGPTFAHRWYTRRAHSWYTRRAQSWRCAIHSYAPARPRRRSARAQLAPYLPPSLTAPFDRVTEGW